MTNLEDTCPAVRLGRPADQDEIIEMSQRVQDKLTASGSLQHIGPLEPEGVAKAITTQKCFVLEQRPPLYTVTKVIGCAILRELEAGYFLSTSEFEMGIFPLPWLYLHSIMLGPEQQGCGMGITFVSDVVKQIASTHPTGGTLFLDCWAGNDKLNKFYSKVGFDLVAVIPEEDYEIAVFFRPLHATDSLLARN